MESDWKMFRKRVPEWRERYLSMKNMEIIATLSDESRSPTEQFWEAKKKMDLEARVLTDCLDGHSRSDMDFYLVLMHRRGLIKDEDMEGFSATLQEEVLGASRGVRA